MNTVYLILAHNQPDLLIRMVNQLNDDGKFFFIHIDRKSKSLNNALSLLKTYPNVKIYSEYAINWMGFSMVQATLFLMNQAIESNVNFKYCVLMSGQDYPIKSRRFINEFFDKNTADFISYNKFSDLDLSFEKKIHYYHFMDIDYLNPRSQQNKSFLIWLNNGLYKHLGKYFSRRNFYKNMEPYFGSQWFSLRKDTVRYILNFVSANKGYMKYMKYTQGPDEFFFQTILLNSDFRNNLFDYNRYQTWSLSKKVKEVFHHKYSSLRYMDWSERANPKPAVLTEEYFNDLKNSNDLFARKFDEKKSASLLDLIDKQLLL